MATLGFYLFAWDATENEQCLLIVWIMFLNSLDPAKKVKSEQIHHMLCSRNLCISLKKKKKNFVKLSLYSDTKVLFILYF